MSYSLYINLAITRSGFSTFRVILWSQVMQFAIQCQSNLSRSSNHVFSLLDVISKERKYLWSIGFTFYKNYPYTQKYG